MPHSRWADQCCLKNIQFLDTEKKNLHSNGWNLRVRKTEDEKFFEITYKKRYLIGNGISANADDNIDAALEEAKQDGFNMVTPFEAQVEVGYTQQTLSISQDVEISGMGFAGIDLPPAKQSRQFLADKASEEFKSWLSGNSRGDYLKDSRVYGPVSTRRTMFDWAGTRISIKVWLIRKSEADAELEPIVEASFKTDELTEALKGRTNVEEFLLAKGWFLAGDSLRTKLIMDRYGGVDS